MLPPPQVNDAANPKLGRPMKVATPPVEPPAAPAAPNHSWDNGMPSYEEMICMALTDLASVEGSAPKAIFEWMIKYVS